MASLIIKIKEEIHTVMKKIFSYIKNGQLLQKHSKKNFFERRGFKFSKKNIFKKNFETKKSFQCYLKNILIQPIVADKICLLINYML